MRGSPEAQALHRLAPAIDFHADTLMWCRWVGYDLAVRHDPPLFRSAWAGHVDVPRLREGGIGAQFFGLVSLPVAGRGCARAIDEQIDALDALADARPDVIRKVQSAEELQRASDAGVTAGLMGIEGAHALEGDLEKLEHFRKRGVKYLGLMHFSRNQAGFPAMGLGRSDAGLTVWGKELVARCESLGVMVDLAHLNRAGFLDACQMATRPPIVSHTGVLGAHRHWRNIDDEQLRALAEKGGVAGVIFVPAYVGGEGLEPVVRHLLHIVNVAGEDVAALGSDWDGMVVPTRDLRDASHLPLLTDALLKAGLSERVIRKILRENALRVLAASDR